MAGENWHDYNPETPNAEALTMASYLLLPMLLCFLLPPGCNLLLLLAGFGLTFYSKKLGGWIIAGSIALLWLMSTPYVAYNCIEILQNRYPVLALDALPQVGRHPVIVVLGSGNNVSVEEKNRDVPSETELHRLHYAALLHARTGYPVIVSGGRGRGFHFTEASAMQQALKEDFHVPSVIQENNSHNTNDESRMILPLLKQHGFDTVYLVTNAWHMPRSVYLFRREGISVVPAPMGYYVYDHRYSILSFLPNSLAYHVMSFAMHEWMGLFWIR